MLYTDIERDYAQELRHFREQPLKHSPPNGETLTEVMKRFFEVLNEFAEVHADSTSSLLR